MRALRVFAAANNGLTEVLAIAELRGLQTLDISKNGIESVASVVPIFSSALGITELDMRDNPLSANRQALDAVIVSCRDLHDLNGRTVTQSERLYLEQLRRRGTRSSLTDLG